MTTARARPRRQLSVERTGPRRWRRPASTSRGHARRAAPAIGPLTALATPGHRVRCIFAFLARPRRASAATSCSASGSVFIPPEPSRARRGLPPRRSSACVALDLGADRPRPRAPLVTDPVRRQARRATATIASTGEQRLLLEALAHRPARRGRSCSTAASWSEVPLGAAPGGRGDARWRRTSTSFPPGRAACRRPGHRRTHRGQQQQRAECSCGPQQAEPWSGVPVADPPRRSAGRPRDAPRRRRSGGLRGRVASVAPVAAAKAVSGSASGCSTQARRACAVVPSAQAAAGRQGSGISIRSASGCSTPRAGGGRTPARSCRRRSRRSARPSAGPRRRRQSHQPAPVAAVAPVVAGQRRSGRSGRFA